MHARKKLQKSSTFVEQNMVVDSSDDSDDQEQELAAENTSQFPIPITTEIKSEPEDDEHDDEEITDNKVYESDESDFAGAEIKEEESDAEVQKDVLIPAVNKLNNIKNKIVRNEKYHKLKREEKKAKKLEKARRKQEGGPKQVPHTLDTLREFDETTVTDLGAKENEVICVDLAQDEFSEYFNQSYEPKILITFSDNPTTKTRIFGKELTRVIPNSKFLYRNRSGVKKMVKSATEHGYTDLLIINENRKEPNGLLVIHLPDGPTAHFKLSNVRLTPELRKNHKNITEHRPEVVLNNFTTRLGLTVGRMFGALFHHSPEFEGRRAVTFHNQRDFIFFRHYKYTFNADGSKSRLYELGPRFTMKLQSLQKGTFDSKYGEYIWLLQGRRRKVETSRRKFAL